MASAKAQGWEQGWPAQDRARGSREQREWTGEQGQRLTGPGSPGESEQGPRDVDNLGTESQEGAGSHCSGPDEKGRGLGDGDARPVHPASVWPGTAASVPDELNRFGYSRWLTHSFGYVSSPAPRQKAPQSDKVPHGDDVSQADLDIATFSSHLEAVTLESKDPEGAEEDP